MHESGDKHDFVKLLDDPFQEGPIELWFIAFASHTTVWCSFAKSHFHKRPCDNY